MEEPLSDEAAKKSPTSDKQRQQSSVSSMQIPMKVSKTTKPTISANSHLLTPIGSIRKRTEPKNSSDSSSNVTAKNASSCNTKSVPIARRNSTGGVPEKQPVSSTKRQNTSGKANAVSDPVRRSLPELRRSSLPPTKPMVRTGSVSETRNSVPMDKCLRASTGSGVSRLEKPSAKPALPTSSSSSSSSRRVISTSVDSTASSMSRKKLSSPSARSPSVSSGLRAGSLSTSRDRSFNLTGRRRAGAPESHDSHFIALPLVETKAGDDVRLDLRGHKVRSLNASGLNLAQNLEFVYLRDNLLSTLEGIEILKRVKVLDLSFNEFKGAGFEPLENCQALQQLYLAGNQITSLVNLPQLPNLEFLSVAQNKLKSLSMAGQPRLQVLAASKNKITTLKGFPHLPSLEHLRVEENPILKMPHLEAASILLVGLTLKKFNDRDLSREEVAIAKRYPACTALCIRDGWELCRPENAADSTFHFLYEQWKEHFPPGYLLKDALVDQPFEGDACHCDFVFVQDNNLSATPLLVLKYQWFVGERALSSFAAIPDATGEVYWPKHEDIGKFLKVECTSVMGEIEYPPIFAISSRVSPGNGIPKVVNLEVQGELVEGNVIKGYAGIAWCGGTPGKGVASWLRRRWNSSPVVIVGAEDEEYCLTLDDIDSSLVFMYTPVTEEGAKGEPQYKYTDFVKAAPPSVSNVRIIGDIVEGNIIKGVGDYFGGKEGPSKFEWLRENKNTGDFVSISTGTSEYALTNEDVGRCLAFVYSPINFEGQEGKSVSIFSHPVKQAPPKVKNIKIIGHLRENSKVTVTATVTGGTEGSSRVQWFKTSSSTLDGENSLDALITAKIAKALRIPLGAVGYYIVAKYIPMTPDGESGEPAYAISEKAVETLPPSLNFLSISGDYIEGGILTASYGYVGGHEGKSEYNWFLHEFERDNGTLILEGSGVLRYCVTRDAIGKFISFQCIPVRDDGIASEPRTCMGVERIRPGSPRLLSLQIVGNAIEGTSLSVDKKYWGGEEGNSVFCWYRTSSDGAQIEIQGANTSSYMLSVDDIGSFVSVSCEPVRSDWACGPTIFSEQIGPIIPGPPTCQSLEFLGSMMEGQRLSFVASYSGGERGNCFHEWFRVKSGGIREKLRVDEYLDLTLEDAGQCIELVYTPIRKDGMKGSPRTILSDVIVPADPVGLELVIPNCYEDNEAIPQKTYFGGQEGAGEYIWFRTRDKLNKSELLDISNAGDDDLICGKTLAYTPSIEDVGAYLALYWLPTRADGKCGKPLVTISNSPVNPALPVVSNVHVKELSSGVYAGEGKYFGGHEGLSLFSWYRETNEGTIILINGANSRTYKVTDLDYNCCLLFGYTPVRSDSVVGELKLSEPTNIILPELPQVEMVALTGKAIEGDVLTAVEVIPKSETQRNVWSKYKKEVKYQWFCSTVTGDGSFELLPAQHSCSYKLRLEDIGRRFRCECIVTDVFGRLNELAYAETDAVLPEPDVFKEVKQKIELGSVKFEALCDKDRSPKKVLGEGGSLERRILEVNRKSVKVVKPGSKTSFPTTEIRGSYAPPFHVELFRNDQHRLRIVVDSENEVDLMVHSRHLRDVIALVIRGFAQRFNSTSLNSLLKIDNNHGVK